jgi:uncharacterized protein (DUF58 family)
MSLFTPSTPRRRHFNWRELRHSLSATLALGLSLGASLASSVAASEGNLTAAIALAIFALLLALVIALTVVPRLFRRARLEWLRFSISITREGWIYLLALLVVAFAAFNTGNNLIFIILSAALALLLVSEALSSLNLRWLSLAIDLPEAIPARESFVSVLKLKNLKSWFPAFSLSLESPIRPVNSRAGSEQEPPLPLAYYPFVGSRRQVAHRVTLQLPHRGLHQIDRVTVATRFPFGFVNRKKKLPQTASLIALPQVETSSELFEMLPLLSGAFESFHRGRGSDLHSIREYSPRDSARFLDWKASAKTGRLLVREFTNEDDRKCCFVFDNGVPHYEEHDERAFEKAVCLCANIVRHFHGLNCDIRLITPQESTQYSKSDEGLLEILTLLALIQPGDPARLKLTDLLNERAFKILFTPVVRGEIPTALWSSSHAVFYREWPDRAGLRNRTV